LNIWTPGTNGRRPVMLWVHGGGNFAGAAASDVYGDGSANTYDGESLSRRGVVVVTANYRLTTFGFFAHRDLSAASAYRASGNYGLLDQVAALRW
jgi:para-nitrobenzyl esterase